MNVEAKRLGPKTKIGEVAFVEVSDCFCGEVKLLRKKNSSKRDSTKYYVKILWSSKCYRTQKDIPDGRKMWIPQRLLCEPKRPTIKERFRRLFTKTVY